MGLTEVRIEGIPEVMRRIGKMTQEQVLALRVETKRHAQMAQALIKRRYSGQALDTRSGLLRKSVLVRKVSRDGWEVGTPIRYAATHEEGGTIRPRNRGGRFIVTGRRADGSLKGRMSKGSKLAIPIGRAKTKKSGVAKSPQIDRTGMDLSRGLPFSTFVRKGVLMLSTLMVSGRYKLEPLAALKDRVKIPRRPVWSVASRVVGRAFRESIDRNVYRLIRKHGGA